MADSDRIDEDTKFARELDRQSTDSERVPSSISESSISKRVEKARPILKLLEELKKQEDQPKQYVGCEDEPAWIGDIQYLCRFEIKQEIGRGGNGIVLLAIDSQLDRRVALKIPRFESALSGSTRRRFEREAQAAAMLNHPAIVTVFESGHDRGLHFIASEFIDGENLAQWITKQTKIDFPQSAELVAFLAEAIEHAHRRGVLHRDLKAANVIVQKAEPGNANQSLAQRCRITDFGLATLMTGKGSVTGSGAIVGTPSCMSPEQASGGKLPVDARTDVYGLGTILYQLLTGKAPFEGDDIAEIIGFVKSLDPVAPQRITPGTPADLNAICMRCLEKEPANRYASAFDLQKDLQRFINGETVVARPVSRGRKLFRWVMRNPRTATMIGAIIGLMLLLTIGSICASISLNRSRLDVFEHLNREKSANELATQKEIAALESLYESNIVSARALVKSGHLGQSQAALASVMAAAKLEDRIEIDLDQRAVMRGIIADSAKLLDMSLESDYRIENLRKNVAHNRDVDMYAVRSDAGQTIEVRRCSDNSIHCRLNANVNFRSEPYLMFSPNSKYLGAAFKDEDSKTKLAIWNLEAPQQRAIQFEIPWSPKGRFDFSHDDNCLAYINPESQIVFYDLLEDKVVSTRGQRQFRFVKFANRDRTVAAADLRNLIFLDFAPTGPRELGQIEFTELVFDLEWSSDDSQLAVGANDRSCYVFDTKSKSLKTRITGHGWQVVEVAFYPNSQWVGTYSRDRISRIHCVETGDKLFQANGIRIERFDPAGKFVATQTGRYDFWEISTYQKFPIHSKSHQVPSTCFDGRILAICQHGDFHFFDLETGQQHAFEHVVGSFGWIVPDESRLVIASQFGVYSAELAVADVEDKSILRIGPPLRLRDGNFGGCLVTDYSGKHAAITVHYPFDNGEQKSGVFDLGQQTWSPLSPKHRGARWQDITTNGKRMATGTWHGNGVRIWDTGTGTCLHQIAQGSCQVKFAPDGSMLALDNGHELTVVETSQWETVFARKKDILFATTPIAFSNDQKVIAILRDSNTVELFQTSDFSWLYSLNVPEDQLIESLTFARNDRWLIAASNNQVHVWDLQRLESLFRNAHIETGIIKSIEQGKPKRVEIDFDPGELRLQSDSFVVSRVIRRAQTYLEEFKNATKESTIPIACERHMTSLGKIDLTNCPGKFRSAFTSYINSWKKMNRMLIPHQQIGVEFDELWSGLIASDDDESRRLATAKKGVEREWAQCLKIERDLVSSLQN